MDLTVKAKMNFAKMKAKMNFEKNLAKNIRTNTKSI